MKFLDKIKNWFQPRLYWKNIFKYYAEQSFRSKSSVNIISPNREKSVLVLCPHIDDDAIGLGGMLYKYRILAIPVTVIYFTTENERRKKEGENLSSYFNYRKVSFHNFPVEQISKYSEIKEIILNVLTETAYDVIYVPFHLDRHKDHIALSFHLAAALRKIPDLRSEIRCYEVWAPLFPNQVVDISDVIEHKKNGIGLCESQMESVNYIDLALSLNRYRGISSTREKQMNYAEAFYSCTPVAFRMMVSGSLVAGPGR